MNHSNGEIMRAILKKRAIDIERKPFGIRNNNPLMDTMRYKVEFLDGSMDL